MAIYIRGRWGNLTLSNDTYRLRAGSRIGSADGRIIFQKESEHIHLSDLFIPLGKKAHTWDAKIVENAEESPQVWNMTHKISTEDAIGEVAIGRPKYLEQFMALVKIARKTSHQKYCGFKTMKCLQWCLASAMDWTCPRKN